jgi:hypothetical protein
MGLLDKLVDRVIDRIKKNKADSIVSNLKKKNPEFSKALDDYQKAVDKMKKALDKQKFKPTSL